MNLFRTVIVCALMAAAPAWAAPLAPGGIINPTGTTAADPVHGGIQTVINDNLIQFGIDPTPATPLTLMNGFVQNRVTDPVVGDNLRFAPRIRDTQFIEPGTFLIDSFSLTGYAGFSTDVEFRTDGLGDVGFESVSRSADGDRLNFRFDEFLRIDGIAPGLRQESLFPSIVTDAQAFNYSGTMTIVGYLLNLDANGAIIPPSANDIFSVTIGGIAAPTTVPLPASAFLLIAGLAGLAGMRRRS